jgi:hypothetical protein
VEFQEKYNRVITSSSPHLQDRDECHAEAMQSRHLPFQYTCSVLQHPADGRPVKTYISVNQQLDLPDSKKSSSV